MQPGFVLNCRCNIVVFPALQRLSKSREQDQVAEHNKAGVARKKRGSNHALWCMYVKVCLFPTVLFLVTMCVKPALRIGILLWKLINLKQNWKQDSVRHLFDTCVSQWHFLAQNPEPLRSSHETAPAACWRCTCWTDRVYAQVFTHLLLKMRTFSVLFYYSVTSGLSGIFDVFISSRIWTWSLHCDTISEVFWFYATAEVVEKLWNVPSPCI